MNSNRKTVRLNEWYECALDTLLKEGPDKLRPDIIASKLNVSKSSFYWHFKNGDELINQALQYWDDEYTKTVTKSPLMSQISPTERLYQTMIMIYDNNLTRYEPCIRAMAEYVPKAKKIILHVYSERMSFLRSIFKELGFKGEELEFRTRQFVCYHSWENIMFTKDSRKKKLQLMKRHVALLTKK